MVTLAPDHPGLHLIQRIRDEAHRFAIAGHRARRSKRRIRRRSRASRESERSAANSCSRARRAEGSPGASVEDLTQVEGISRKLAEKIYRELHAA